MNPLRTLRHVFCFGLCAALAGIPALSALEFRVIGLGQAIDDIFYRDGTKEVKLYVPFQTLSGEYHISGGSTRLKLYRKVPAVAVAVAASETAAVSQAQGAATEQIVPLAEIDVPQGSTQAILVFMNPAAGSAQAGEFATVWLDNSGRAGRRNELRFHNFSPAELAVNAQGRRWSLAQGASDSGTFAASARSLPMQVAARGANAWSLVYTNSIPVRDGFNAFVFFTPAEAEEDGLTRAVNLVCVYEAAQSGE